MGYFMEIFYCIRKALLNRYCFTVNAPFPRLSRLQALSPAPFDSSAFLLGPKMTSHLIVGATGAIGSALSDRLVTKSEPVLALVHRRGLPDALANDPLVTTEKGFNVRSDDIVEATLAKYADKTRTVWNLAAPLSVDTAKDPETANDITVKGMGRLLRAMENHGVSKMMFADSIGSYGKGNPLDNVRAAWLLENPDHDPGTDYGIQKRECRKLMASFENLDTRFAVIPGVLHAQASWGGGTTEYALDALLAAVKGEEFPCPVPIDAKLPFIHIDDLTDGLLRLEGAKKEQLKEPQGAYSLAGFSFTPAELFEEIRLYYPDFTYRIEINPPAALCASLWCQVLSPVEAERDFGFTSSHGFKDTVKEIITAHEERLGKTQE